MCDGDANLPIVVRSPSTISILSTTSSMTSGNVDAYDRNALKGLSPPTKSLSWNFGMPFHKPHAAYAFDHSTTITLGTIAPSEATERIKIHVYYRDQGPPQAQRDWFAILGSLTKLIEASILYKAGAQDLWWITTISWTPVYLSALSLQLLGVGRDDSNVGEIDLIAGELPSPLHPGGVGKVLLGMPGNIRRSTLWKVHWGIQSLSCIVGSVAIFTSLPAQHPTVVYIWVAFQILWMVLRILVYHGAWLAPSGPVQAMVVGHSWDASSLATKRRAVQLVFALASQQVTIHPRGLHVYQEDILRVSMLASIWRSAAWCIEDTLEVDPALCFQDSPFQQDRYIHIEVLGVVGDTLLRSAAWFQGLGLPNPELYDCALIFVKLGTSSVIHCIPSARVLCQRYPQSGSEDFGGFFCPRGTTNIGDVAWNFWIPIGLSPASCLNSSSSDINHQLHWADMQGQEIVGKKHKALIRDWPGLQSHLQSGVLNVSLSQAQEITDIIGTARKAVRGLKDILVSVMPEQ